MIYLGIDPGVSGGIAVVWWPGEVRVHPIPATDRDLLLLLSAWRSVVDPMPGGFRPVAFAMLERVWGMPGWGAKNFRFGQSYGALRMALAAHRIPFEEVLPQQWQKAMGIVYPKRQAGERRDKNITKQRAAALFPQLTMTHAIADALLIAEFCRRTHRSRDGEKEGREAEGRAAGRSGRTAREKGDKEGGRRKAEAGAAVGAAAGARAGSEYAAGQSVRGDLRRSAHDGGGAGRRAGLDPGGAARDEAKKHRRA